MIESCGPSDENAIGDGIAPRTDAPEQRRSAIETGGHPWRTIATTPAAGNNLSGLPIQDTPNRSRPRDLPIATGRRSGLWCLPWLAPCRSSRLYSTAAHARMGRAIWPLSEAFLPLSLAVRPGTLKQVNARSNNQPLPPRRSADERRDALFRQYPDVRAPDGPGRTQAFARALANSGQQQCERSSSPLKSARYLFD
jgi:hypothetical protein